MILYINQNWTFKQTVANIETLKFLYKGTLASFSYYDIKLRNKFLYETKKQIYSLNFEEWKRDKLWSYMNDYEFLHVLKDIANRQKY